MRKFGAAVAIVVLMGTAACGGSNRPSQDEVSKAIRNGKSLVGEPGKSLSKKQADCAAKALLKSKISDKGMKAFVKGDEKYKPSKADKAGETQIEKDLEKCAS